MRGLYYIAQRMHRSHSRLFQRNVITFNWLDEGIARPTFPFSLPPQRRRNDKKLSVILLRRTGRKKFGFFPYYPTCSSCIYRRKKKRSWVGNEGRTENPADGGIWRILSHMNVPLRSYELVLRACFAMCAAHYMPGSTSRPRTGCVVAWLVYRTCDDAFWGRLLNRTHSHSGRNFYRLAHLFQLEKVGRKIEKRKISSLDWKFDRIGT